MLELSLIASDYINAKLEKDYDCGVYQFMEHFGIGHSEYRAYLDILGKSEQFINKFIIKYNDKLSNQMIENLLKASNRDINYMAHRLSGHHIIGDFPYNEVEKIPDFLEHILSDAFTKGGLPILPEQLLQNTSLIHYAKRLNNNWNMINGYQLLAATISIYNSSVSYKLVANKKISFESLGEIANELGIGIFEFCIALSKSNPFLLIGSIVRLSTTIRGCLNDAGDVFFENLLKNFTMEIDIDSISINKQMYSSNIERLFDDIKIENFFENNKKRY